MMLSMFFGWFNTCWLCSIYLIFGHSVFFVYTLASMPYLVLTTIVCSQGYRDLVPLSGNRTEVLECRWDYTKQKLICALKNSPTSKDIFYFLIQCQPYLRSVELPSPYLSSCIKLQLVFLLQRLLSRDLQIDTMR